MAKTPRTGTVDVSNVVKTYFGLIRDLRRGKANSVPDLMELWTQDGTFEFAGSPPLEGQFKGAMAIHTLYKNRINNNGMDLRLDFQKNDKDSIQLGLVDTEVTHMKVSGNRVVAAWRTTIGTQQGHGYDVSGAHVFTFEGDKIKNLRVTISPKPDASRLDSLRLDDLSVTDIGRLALAAWPVV